MQALADKIRAVAREVGIDVVGITHAGRFERYLLAQSPRRDPHLALPEARSIVLAGIYIGGFSLPTWDDPAMGRTSRLFLSGFYADVVAPLMPVAILLREQGFTAAVCDTFESGRSILPLKLAAVRAGIGWQGKNSLLISPRFGSFLALGGLITDAPLPWDESPQADRCGKCRACREACPLNALEEPFRLKRERCLSHLLEEDSLAEEARAAMGNRVVECEICQEACPWNRKHLRRPLDTRWTRQFREEAAGLSQLFQLDSLAKMSEREYEERIDPYRSGISYEVFRRNVAAAMENGK